MGTIYHPVTFDPRKDVSNVAKHRLSLAEAADFEFETAIFGIDTRFDYGEVRRIAIGMLRGRLHAIVFVEMLMGVRVISLRKANQREQRKYRAKI